MISFSGVYKPVELLGGDMFDIIEIDIVGIPICEIYKYNICKINEFKVETGDELLLYTDGISEAKDNNGIFFAEKFNEVLEHKKTLEIDKMVNEIIKITLKHSGGLINDDMAIMGIELL